LNGQIAVDIRNAFTGGRTESIIPYSENQHQYDVNSLYPFIMSRKPVPVGPIHYFEGDILKRDPSAHGFFYCKVTSPEEMFIPLLQTKVKTEAGIRTISPLGV